MDMNDIKDWASRASASGPPLTPDEGGSAAPEAPPPDPHENSTALKSLGESAKQMADDLKTAKDKAASAFPDVDLKAIDDLVAALETGSADLAEASDDLMEAEEEAEEEAEDEEEVSDDEDDEDEDGPPGLA
jgi:hypothetical protein